MIFLFWLLWNPIMTKGKIGEVQFFQYSNLWKITVNNNACLAYYILIIFQHLQSYPGVFGSFWQHLYILFHFGSNKKASGTSAWCYSCVCFCLFPLPTSIHGYSVLNIYNSGFGFRKMSCSGKTHWISQCYSRFYDPKFLSLLEEKDSRNWN